MHTITATDLKQNTRKVLNMAQKSPVEIYRYGEPEVVIISFSNWKKFMTKKNKKHSGRFSKQKLKKFTVHDKTMPDSVTFFRQLRDE